MNPGDATAQRIRQILDSQRIVLFMKGSRQRPQCGFSAQVVQILDSLLPDYASVDVLQDAELRQGIKDFSNWPTIPQLFVAGELVGGCDIITEMFQSGELQQALAPAGGAAGG